MMRFAARRVLRGRCRRCGPRASSGELVRTLDSHVAYYERWAKTWEFQALLKARPAAGDAELGEQYIDGADADGVDGVRA